MFTPFAELDSVLADLTASAREILGDTFVGAYLQGSFALGAGDRHSDCDFLIATTTPTTGAAEDQLRRLHDEIPTREGFWTTEIEGSYADITSLRSAAGLGVPWLYNDHGHRTLIWHTHCNSLHTRWILRHHGITMAGPPIASLVDEVPAEGLRQEARRTLAGLIPGTQEWISLEIAWAQRYLVTTYCRALYTVVTARVASKRGALQWARENLDPQWQPLLTQVIEDRALGWEPDEPPRPGSLERTFEFAAHAEALAG